MKYLRRIRLATAFPFILGVFTGTMITTFLLLAVRSIDDDRGPSVKVRDDSEDNIHTMLEKNKGDEDTEFGQINDGNFEMNLVDLMSPRQLVSYNVLSTRDTLRTRAIAIHQTWGSNLGARGHIQYYVFPPADEDEVKFAIEKRIPVTFLDSRQGEDDDYTDERSGKRNVLELWKDVCKQRIDQYQWFVKLEDDVYLRTQELEQTLSSLNSSEPILLGRAVFPYGVTRDELGLREGESFCFEGGYAVSWKTLQMVCPHLSSCQENARSRNEDVEMARCIRMHTGVNCTSAVELRELFHVAESLIDQEELQLGAHHLNPVIKRALLLSPLRDPEHFYHLHEYYTKEYIKLFKNVTISLRSHMIQTAERDAHSDSLLQTSEHHSPSWTKLGVNAPYTVEPGEEVIHFQSLDAQYRYTESMHYPSHSVSNRVRQDIQELTNVVLHSRGFDTDTAEDGTSDIIAIHSILQRMDPQRGTDYFLHVSEAGRNGQKQTKLLHALREAEPPRVLNLKSADYKSTKVNFVIPTPPVSRGFQRFMVSFENSFLSRKPPEQVGLLVILYSDGLFKTYDKDLFSVITLVDLYTKKYPEADLRVVSMKAPHTKRKTIELASKEYPSYELLFFADIHIDFSKQFLERCRMNAVEDKQVYFPAVFSPYNPGEFYKSRILFPYSTKFQIDKDKGSWMHESFHLACIYNYDLSKVLFNDVEEEKEGEKESTEWNLLDQLIKHSDLNIFRSVEPGLVHLWQDGCKEEDLRPKERKLCQHLESTL